MKTIVKAWTLSIIAACLVLSGCAAMPKRPDSMARGDYAYTREYITWLIRKEMKKNDITGLSIALVDDQRVVWAEGFGLADRENTIPAGENTIYRVGSISKLFTATAAMQLTEQGKLDIDKPLRTYLPGFSIKSRFPDAAPITPRSIMTHHSGLPSDMLKGMWTQEPEPFKNVLTLLRDEYSAYPPNFIYSYSNLGVTILGHAIETIACRDFSSHMEASILQPLGMTHSSFSAAPDNSPLGARAYRNNEKAGELPLRDIPAGGLNSSVLDLSRFMKMVFANGRTDERRIVKPETLAEMLRPQNSNVPLDLDFRIGLGWMLSGMGSDTIKNAGPVAHHGGSTLYHRSQLTILPEQKLGVVVLSNSATAEGVVGKIAEEALKHALEAKSGILRTEREKPAVHDKTALSRETLQTYEGNYATMAGFATISNRPDHLRAEIMDTNLRLIPRHDGLLGLQYRLLGLLPISLGELDKIGFSNATVAGRDILKANVSGREFLAGEKITPVAIPALWQQRIGEYEIINGGKEPFLPSTVHVRNNAGILLVDYSAPDAGKMSLAIKPLSDSEAVVYGLGRGMGETIRVVNVDGKELFQYSGYLFRKR